MKDMNEVMAACLGIVDAISAGQDPEVAKKKRARTVREVERYVKKLGKARLLVSFLNGKRREIRYGKGEKVESVMLRSRGTLTTEEAARIASSKGTLEGLWTPLGYGVLLYPVVD